jgi:UDP-glucose 4-epimerase
MYKTKIKYLPKRAGERYASALINKNLANKVYKHFGKIDLKQYINFFLKKNS